MGVVFELKNCSTQRIKFIKDVKIRDGVIKVGWTGYKALWTKRAGRNLRFRKQIWIDTEYRTFLNVPEGMALIYDQKDFPKDSYIIIKGE